MKPFSISRQWFRETQNAKIQNFITKKPKNQHKNTHIMKAFSQHMLTLVITRPMLEDFINSPGPKQ